jgi:hypothetical protein
VTANGPDGDRAEQEVFLDLAQEVFHHELNPSRMNRRAMTSR